MALGCHCFLVAPNTCDLLLHLPPLQMAADSKKFRGFAHSWRQEEELWRKASSDPFQKNEEQQD
jgi:hypothetical protein